MLFTINVRFGTYFVYFQWYLKKTLFVLSLVPVLKQISIKNRTYYIHNDIVNLKIFDSNFLKTDKKHYKRIMIYYIGYIKTKKIDNCENIHSVNPLYLFVNHARGYI